MQQPFAYDLRVEKLACFCFDSQGLAECECFWLRVNSWIVSSRKNHSQRKLCVVCG